MASLTDLEKLKKKRTPIRGQVTRLTGEIETALQIDIPDNNGILAQVQVLEKWMGSLQKLDTQIYDMMVELNLPDIELDQECQMVGDYDKKCHFSRMKANNFLAQPLPSADGLVQDSVSTCSDMGRRKLLCLPKVELPKYDGDHKEWLCWWAQFAKIHDDPEIHDVDKFYYLKQCMKPGSQASDVVSIYPLRGENYEAAVEALKDAFGREDLLLQVYVRELLMLVISTATNQGKIPLAQLYIKLESHLRSLATLNLNSADPATWLFPMVESSLREETLRAWQRSPLSKTDGSKLDPPKTRLDLLMEFIKNEVHNEQQILLARTCFQTGSNEVSSCSNAHRQSKRGSGHKFDEVATAANLVSTPVSSGCLFCNGKHSSDKCIKSQSMPLEDRRKLVREKRFCFQCLKAKHVAKNCKERVQCIMCGGKHYPIVCPKIPLKEVKISGSWETQPGTSDQIEEPKMIANCSNFCTAETLLNTLVVQLRANGNCMNVRVVGDTGNQRSYVRRAIVSQLGINSLGEEWLQSVLFGGRKTVPECHSKFAVTLTNGEQSQEIIVLEKNRICLPLPKVPRGKWDTELNRLGITLSDSGSGCQEVDLLIGNDYWGSLLTGRIVILNCGLTAIETILGWTLGGKLEQSTTQTVTTTHNMFVTLTDATNLWSLESLGIMDEIGIKSKQQEELDAVNHFKNSVSRDDSGRYIVSLPWRCSKDLLPTNFEVATKRLQNITQRLKTQEKFRLYNEVFQNWQREGIIRELISDDKNGHYLPHRPVFKESATTPVRPVFDASCRVGKKPSLNDCLFKGANFIELVPKLLLQFREKKIGVSADIRKAFQMITVHKDDQRFQKFLWWKDDSCQSVKVYQHERVLFGMNCSPFLLGATIDHHLGSVVLQDELSLKLRRSFYVDNCITSVDSEIERDRFQLYAIKIMKEAGMDLRQWAFSGDQNSNPKFGVLGLLWNRNDDVLSCVTKVNISEMDVITKRKLLSLVSQIFDPIGFTCPAILPIKALVQETWVMQLGWDEPVSSDIKSKFCHWITQLEILGKIRIPRHCQMDKCETKELHIFCDASKVGCGVVIFMRSQLQAKVHVQLVSAKSRLAPVKRQRGQETRTSIPRLELLACWMGVSLAKIVKEVYPAESNQYHYWSDSTTALAWVRRNEHWGTYVGNRVTKILAESSADQWHHVPGELNPADLPSRGCTPAQLLQSKWWEGPEWLLDREKWPSGTEAVNEQAVNLERRRTATNLLNSVSMEQPRFSTYRKNVAMWGWVLRYLDRRVFRKNYYNSKYLRDMEMRKAEIIRLRKIQLESSLEQLAVSKKFVTSLDSDGLYRVVTRIVNRADRDLFLRPILLSENHPLVQQLIMDAHLVNIHAGIQTTMSKLREKYWIVHSRRWVRKVIHQCVKCRRHEARSLSVDPVPLPVLRVTSGDVFATTGVDLAGPLLLNDGSKTWVVLYTCAVYRCVFLDLVNSLSTEAFLNSLERFIGLYGRPNTLYSDNGTNFVGASNLFNTLNWEEIEAQSNVKQISWMFNPPTASWWGGFWERLVRTTKDLLKKNLGRARLNFDQLRTCLAGVTSIINDRPLTVVKDDVNDLIPLTPAMFLKGNPLSHFPETIGTDSLSRAYHRMKEKQQLLQQRFRKEYLGLIVMQANNQKSRAISVGDVVLVGSDNKKRFEWPLGIVTELIPGKDGKHRTVWIKTTTGFIIRPFQRLYPLEVHHDELELQTSKEIKNRGSVTSAETHSLEATIEKSTEKVTSPNMITRSGRKVHPRNFYGSWKV